MIPSDPVLASIRPSARQGGASVKVSTDGCGIELKGCNFAQLSELHQTRLREILTVIEFLDVVLANPIILLIRT